MFNRNATNQPKHSKILRASTKADGEYGQKSRHIDRKEELVMEITYVIIIAIIAYIFGAITKIFVDSIPNKYIPIQNVIIGVISAIICYFTGIEPSLLQSIVLCIVATMGAGGVADLINIKKEG